MSELEAIRGSIPDPAKDIRLNLQAVVGEGSLSPAQRWGVAISSALAARSDELTRALVSTALLHVPNAVVEDAIAAASLMAMNNVFYRFKHIVGKQSYSTKPARLRMNRLAQPATNKLDFELFCLAVSAINNCEACVKAHEKTVIDGGLTEDQVIDAIRISATVHAAAHALESRTVIELMADTTAQASA